MIVTNKVSISPKAVRIRTLDQRQHYVAPVVMMCEGVHAGNGGPIYYSAEVLGNVAETWDHKPIVVYHPQIDGVFVSACMPDVLNTQKVGVILNARFDKATKKLRAEAWIDVERAREIDPRINERIEANQLMEVSIGSRLGSTQESGEWNEEHYDMVANQIFPDHLALLPDQEGACSIADGAGLLQVNSSSAEYIRRMLEVELSKRLSAMGKRTNHHIVDVFDSTFVFFHYDELGGSAEYSGEFERTGHKISIKDAPFIRVVRDSVYRDSETSEIVAMTKGLPMPERIVKVSAIIANNACWTNDTLAKLSDAQIDALFVSTQQSSTETETEETEETVTTPVADKAQQSEAPAKTTVVNQTWEQLFKSASPQMQEVLNELVANHNTEKLRLIEQITANAANPFSKEELATYNVPMLRKLAAMSTPEPRVSMIGNQIGSPFVFHSSVDESDVLPIPQMIQSK